MTSGGHNLGRLEETPLLTVGTGYSEVPASALPLAPNEGPEVAHICSTCGVQFPPSSSPPSGCKICIDDRQYVRKSGQTWTTQASLIRSGHRNAFQVVEPNLMGIGTAPKFGIGQRALLVQTPEGNLLWDCITLLDPATVAIITALGGLKAIAISHPHYYAASAEWSKAFGNCPIHIHGWDKEWVTWPHDSVKLWEGEVLPLWGGLKIVHLGGHFAGAQVCLWEGGAGGKGVLLSGDILQVGADNTTVSVMRSFPNFIPLSAKQVKRIEHKLAPHAYDRIHGAFWDLSIEDNAKEAVEYSLKRYLRWLEDDDIKA